ncbi:MAG: outer membrane protein assembly factor BamE [Candidatus Methylophosphatis roskildensis]|uniref:Outer membrane protein assembly factor BamE n=1 Tax=Candidatus Methylophosphatis roskildensis TaxID=2899263 RepID=A0A9D7E2E7_9PROT|nr:outer membrane protein assembly factor BamE [Candidatus Methylophosphatis roskildensis]MBK7235405.1 outer membrane protein assembly factor BamE [Sterolibacteriaceae bacterium]
MKSSAVLASLVLYSLVLPACSVTQYLNPYLVDIRQGNYVTQDMVAQLKPGMTKDQVRFALGTPLVTDIFHGERWDYVYRFKPGRGDVQQRHLSVFFDQGKLVRVGGDVVASGAAGAEAADGQPQAAPKVIEIGADGKPPVEPKLEPKSAPADEPGS